MNNTMSTVTGTVRNALVRPKVIYLKLHENNHEVVVFRNRGKIYDLARTLIEGIEITATGEHEIDKYGEKLLASSLSVVNDTDNDTEGSTDTVQWEDLGTFHGIRYRCNTADYTHWQESHDGEQWTDCPPAWF